MNKFHEWIKARGVEKLARRIGVNRSTVYRWLRGSVPDPEPLQVLLRLARGKFKLSDVYDFNLRKEVSHEHREAVERDGRCANRQDQTLTGRNCA